MTDLTDARSIPAEMVIPGDVMFRDVAYTVTEIDVDENGASIVGCREDGELFTFTCAPRHPVLLLPPITDREWT